MGRDHKLQRTTAKPSLHALTFELQCFPTKFRETWLLRHLLYTSLAKLECQIKSLGTTKRIQELTEINNS